ncbi:MAG TPA: hypothetical protein VFI16_06000, partial [Anaeromyxobacteraceae bacterium]|nr:hypothetical protein [Anaeromyxobacteraceae bacterium]
MPPAFAFRRPRRVPVRPRAAALLLLGAGLGLACHLDDLLRAPPPPEQQPPPPQEEAVRLTFTVQPGTARAHAAITPAVEVTAVDQSGGTVPGFDGQIEVDLATNPEDAALTGTTARRAVRGRAVFDDLTLDEAGAGYRLVARADGVAPAT